MSIRRLAYTTTLYARLEIRPIAATDNDPCHSVGEHNLFACKVLHVTPLKLETLFGDKFN